MKQQIHIDDIKLLKESYQAPDGYFDSLAEKIEARKDEKLPMVRLEDIVPIEESYQVPEGYFKGLVEKIEERKDAENNVVAFRSRRIKIWGSFVAAACITLVVVSVINFGPEKPKGFSDGTSESNYKINIPDAEIVSLLNDRDDEFALTDDEIIEVMHHETIKSETTAINSYLEDGGSLDDEGTSEEGFFESI